MPIQIDKEWAAVDGNDIIVKADEKESVVAKLRKKGLDEGDYEIVALPKSHGSMFV